jgi:hypothetical protein
MSRKQQQHTRCGGRLCRASEAPPHTGLSPSILTLPGYDRLQETGTSRRMQVLAGSVMSIQLISADAFRLI